MNQTTQIDRAHARHAANRGSREFRVDKWTWVISDGECGMDEFDSLPQSHNSTDEDEDDISESIDHGDSNGT